MPCQSLIEHQQLVEQLIDELRHHDDAVTTAKEQIAQVADELTTARARLESARSALAFCAEDDNPCRQRAEQEIEGANQAVNRLERERRLAEEAEHTGRRALQQVLARCMNLARELDADLKKANEQVAHFNDRLASVHSADLADNLYRQGEAAQAAAEGLAELVNRLYTAVASLRHGDNPGSGGGTVATVLGLLGATLGFVSAGLGGSVVGGLAGLVFGKVASSSNNTSCPGAGEQPVAKAARMDFAPSVSPAESTSDRGGMSPPFDVETSRLDSSASFYAIPVSGSFFDNRMDYRATESAAFSSEAPEALVIPPPPSPPSLEAMQAPRATTFGEKPLASTFGEGPSHSTFGETSMVSLGHTFETPGGTIPASPVTLGGAMAASPVTLGGTMPVSPVTLGSAAPSTQPVTLGGASPLFGGSSF